MHISLSSESIQCFDILEYPSYKDKLKISVPKDISRGLHSTYRKINNHEKCADIGLISIKINKKYYMYEREKKILGAV